MEYKDVSFRRLDPAETEKVKELFKSVFCAEPWNDDWSDGEQLDAYIKDLMCQNWCCPTDSSRERSSRASPWGT